MSLFLSLIHKKSYRVINQDDDNIFYLGHSHTFLYTGVSPSVETPKGEYPTYVTQKSGKVVPVVQVRKNSNIVKKQKKICYRPTVTLNIWDIWS